MKALREPAADRAVDGCDASGAQPQIAAPHASLRIGFGDAVAVEIDHVVNALAAAIAAHQPAEAVVAISDRRAVGEHDLGQLAIHVVAIAGLAAGRAAAEGVIADLLLVDARRHDLVGVMQSRPARPGDDLDQAPVTVVSVTSRVRGMRELGQPSGFIVREGAIPRSPQAALVVDRERQIGDWHAGRILALETSGRLLARCPVRKGDGHAIGMHCDVEIGLHAGSEATRHPVAGLARCRAQQVRRLRIEARADAPNLVTLVSDRPFQTVNSLD